jgi:hypothetical protein
MTAATGEEVPVLGPGREVTLAWSQAWLTIAGLVRQRRLADQRLAWSEGKNAARLHDIQERVANPSVRVMNADEREAWERVESETRRVDGPAGAVTVSVGQLGERWGVVAEGATPDGERTDSAYVSCVDEDTAKRLADRLLSAGPGGVEKLQRFATLAAERAEVARVGVREPEEQRLARTEAAIREVWDDELADIVIASPAFGALSWRLHEMEELGYAIKDVLRRIDAARLRDSEVRNPAALAEWFVENMVEKELKSQQVINLDSEEDLNATVPRADGTGLDGAQPAAAAADQERDDAAREAAARREAVEPVLAQAMPADVLDAVQRSRGYEATLALLHDLHRRGATVEPLLHKLPLEQIAASPDPGGHLAAVLRRRAEQNRPQRTGVNRKVMAELVHEGLPPPVADRVVQCRAWPTLAKRLADWNGQGLPLVDMMSKLSAGPIYRADKPAALAVHLLAKAAKTASQEQHPDRGHSTDQQTRHGDAERTSRGPAADDARGSNPHEGGDDAELGWTEDLDPADAIDRVALEATQDMGDATRVTRVQQQLRATAQGNQETGEAAARPMNTTRGRQEIPTDATYSEPARESAAAKRRSADDLPADAPIAAAARAEVTLTPDGEATDTPTRPAGRARREPAGPVRSVAPAQERGRSR